LAAGHAALLHPDAFAAVVCQSPSFWFAGERFAAAVIGSIGRLPPYWISVGDQETSQDIRHPPTGLWQQVSQINACQRAGAALRAQGCAVSCRVFTGGHDPDCWQEDLRLALPWAWAHVQSSV
jgi:enterochelin esterase-like enzyme